MRWLCGISMALLAFSVFGCEELEEDVRCNTNEDCSNGEKCTADNYCKLRVGEQCIRPQECESGKCVNGFCSGLGG